VQVERLGIEGLLLLTPRRHSDERGFFSEVYRADAFAELGLASTFVQDNHARSEQRGVVRGLHYQVAPRSQGKLVRCVRGAILDVVVDIRSGSRTFADHISTELSAENWRQLWIPAGFAHGYVTLEAGCEVIYKTTDYYDPSSERGIAWDDPALGIDWRLPESGAIVSPKDQRNPCLSATQDVFKAGGTWR
jgi:dTDP-4-dehydrorhamnose 3,5-epimerase